jgi:hypothetical protein
VIRPVLLAVAVSLVLGAGSASTARADAAEPVSSTAVVSFEVSGNTDSTLRTQVQAGMARGAAEAGLDLVTYEQVQEALAAKPALAGCLSPSCLVGIAEEVGTDQLIQVTITANGANYDVELALLGSQGVIRRRTGSCTVCTVSDLADLAGTRLTDLLTAVAGAPQTVEIASDPDGATLDIPGAGAQSAPWKGELSPGTLAIQARLPGYLDTTQEITVVDDGSAQRFSITLSPLPPPPPRFHRLKWITAGGALAALITGTVLLAIDGNGTCSASGVTCPREYDTGLAGGLIGVVGLGAAGGAGWMFWRDTF